MVKIRGSNAIVNLEATVPQLSDLKALIGRERKLNSLVHSVTFLATHSSPFFTFFII